MSAGVTRIIISKNIQKFYCGYINTFSLAGELDKLEILYLACVLVIVLPADTCREIGDYEF